MYRNAEDMNRSFNCLYSALKKTGSRCLAENDIPNHHHGCYETECPGELIQIKRQSYTHYFNEKYGRKGPLGDPGYFERSKFFHCSQVEGTSTPSSIVAVNNLQSQHQRRRAPFSPQPLQPLSFLRLFDKGRYDRYEMIPPCTFLIYTSVTIH